MEFNEDELAEIRSIVPIRRHVHPCKDEVPPAAKTKEKRSNSRNSKNNAAAKAASSSKKKGGTTKKTTHKHKDGTAKKVAKSQKLKTRDANKKAKPKDNKGNISSQKRSHIDKHDKKNENGSEAHKFVKKNWQNALAVRNHLNRTCQKHREPHLSRSALIALATALTS